MREFGRRLTQFSRYELYSLGSCSEKFDHFHQALVNAIDHFFPVKVSRVHKSDKPWMTHRIKSSISKRQKCLTKYGKDSPIFKMWRNRVQHLIRYRKSSFYSIKIKSLKIQMYQNDGRQSKVWPVYLAKKATGVTNLLMATTLIQLNI